MGGKGGRGAARHLGVGCGLEVGAMDSAPAFAMDKPFAPGAVRGPEPPENAQSRKNFSVSHLLDLEEVAAGMNGTPAAGPPPAGSGKAVPEPSGGSSGSEAAPQDGESRRPGMGSPGMGQLWGGAVPAVSPLPRARHPGQRGSVSPRRGVGRTGAETGEPRRGELRGCRSPRLGQRDPAP